MFDRLTDLFAEGYSVWIIGNGGSSAEASHFSEELISLGYPAIALNDPQVITALANDFGFEEVFWRYLKAVAKKGDALITLSTSYRSKNILQAMAWADLNGIEVIKLPNQGSTTEEIQNNHLVIIHQIYREFKK